MKNEKLMSDFIMVTDGVLATMPFELMFKILGGDLETVAKKNLQSHEVKI